MAAKKTSNEHVVDVAVPAVKGINLNDIYKAALAAARADVPLVSDLSYEVTGTTKKGDERVYKVRIFWGGAVDDEARSVDDHMEALTVPTAMPPSGLEADK